jgi:hypothetical protein
MPNYLSIRDACAILPGRPHFNTVRRWMFQGCNGIKLRSVRFGQKRLTTGQWCAEFVTAVYALEPNSTAAHQEASAVLDAMGV